jgi:hypothetical protein
LVLKLEEKVILDDSFPSSRKKLVLTDKRLVVYGKKGTFDEWKIVYEIFLDEVKETYGVTDVLTSQPILILKLRKDEQLMFTFGIFSGGIINSVDSKKMAHKYLTAINHQIKKMNNNINQEITNIFF